MAKATSYMTNTDIAKVEKSWQWLIEDQTITEPERISEAADKLLGTVNKGIDDQGLGGLK